MKKLMLILLSLIIADQTFADYRDAQQERKERRQERKETDGNYVTDVVDSTVQVADDVVMDTVGVVDSIFGGGRRERSREQNKNKKEKSQKSNKKKSTTKKSRKSNKKKNKKEQNENTDRALESVNQAAITANEGLGEMVE